MKRFRSLYKVWFYGLLLGSLISVTQAAPAKPTQGKTTKKGAAILRAEAIVGHPLTEAQIKAIRAAGKERKAAMKPVMAKYNAAVAKTLGLSVAEFEKREKAVKAKEKLKK